MAEERRVDAPSGVRIAVTVSGGLDDSTTPVVLVHGMGGSRTTWRPLARELRRRGRTVVSYDLRGHGRTGHGPSYRLDDFVDDLAAVVDDLGAESIDLVGHSLGAHTALRYAMAEPSRVRRLVLEEVPPMPRDDADLAERIVPTATLGERVRGLRALVADPGPFLRFDRNAGQSVMDSFTVADPRWWNELAVVTAPTLVVSGGDRSFLPPRHLRDLAAALPDGRFVGIDAGHSVHRDRGDEFAETVIAHLG